MKGFVKNNSDRAIFRAQRQFTMGGKVSFDALYASFGEASELGEGAKFVEYLRDRFFKEPIWGFYNEDGSPYFKEKKSAAPKAPEEAPKKKVARKKTAAKKKAAKKAPAKGAGRRLKKDTDRVTASQIDAGAIINAELTQAKAMIEQTNDRGILKRALTLSNHLSQKEDHRRLIQRRLEQVYN
jgi:chemotaxis protein histidine kinase CheA